MVVNLKESEQHVHKNGGGWISNTAEVADSVYVGKNAVVYGKAKLSGKVCVVDSAQVSGNVVLSGDAIVSGNCWLSGDFKASTGRFYKNDRVKEKQERVR